MHRDMSYLKLKDLIDRHLPENDGFESYVFEIGAYNESVGHDFKLDGHPNATGVLIISTPLMFDVSFKRWVKAKVCQFGSLESLEQNISSPIQDFMFDRLAPIVKELNEEGIDYELIHDHSMMPSRRPKILMQTCGHISGAAYYYQPMHVFRSDWQPRLPLERNSKFIGLSLHPVYGGHFAFRSVFLFRNCLLKSFKAPRPIPILSEDDQVRNALEKFNYSWRDSNFRDFGSPKIRYSSVQMDFFSKPPAERWSVLSNWLN